MHFLEESLESFSGGIIEDNLIEILWGIHGRLLCALSGEILGGSSRRFLEVIEGFLRKDFRKHYGRLLADCYGKTSGGINR